MAASLGRAGGAPPLLPPSEGRPAGPAGASLFLTRSRIRSSHLERRGGVLLLRAVALLVLQSAVLELSPLARVRLRRPFRADSPHGAAALQPHAGTRLGAGGVVGARLDGVPQVQLVYTCRGEMKQLQL